MLEYPFPYLSSCLLRPLFYIKYALASRSRTAYFLSLALAFPPLSSGADDGRRWMGGNVYLLASFTRRRPSLLYLLSPATYILRTYSSWGNTSLFFLPFVFILGFISGGPPTSTPQVPIRVSRQAGVRPLRCLPLVSFSI